MSFIAMSVALTLATLAADDASERRAKELDEVARVASIMIDGDLSLRIMTPRALERMRTPDPRDKWAAGDNFDVRHEPYIQMKKTLMRLARLVPYPCDVNLWMPFPDRPDRIQILIRNVHELSQFWPWGALDQPMIPEMRQVLDSGARATVRKKPGFMSVLAPVRNSLGDVVGLVEVAAEEPGAKPQPVHARLARPPDAPGAFPPAARAAIAERRRP